MSLMLADHSETAAVPRSFVARLGFGWLLLLCLAGAPGTAQTSSTISGVVRSPDGLPVPGAEVIAEGNGMSRRTTTDAGGRYRLPALMAGAYTLTVRAEGFATEVLSDLRVALDSDLELDLDMRLGSVEETITVSTAPPLLETTTSETGAVVSPEQIETLPVNGRDYLDLMQLVPGVSINREKDEGSDEAVPILGERAGNAIYLVDGMPNGNEFGGGVGAQFNQDTIQEFEVITGGFKAEFGHGSGGVINVLTKRGGNDLEGLVQTFLRDGSLDSDNSLDRSGAPDLSRRNYAIDFGGALVRDRLFAFGSAERIDEERELNFSIPRGTPQVVVDFERSFDLPATTEVNRLFFKLSEQIGDQHTVSQLVSYNDADVTDFLPLSQARSLPSTRNDSRRERTMVGLRDTSLFGDARLYVFEGHLQYRNLFDRITPSHPEAGPLTAFFVFSSTTTLQLFGDEGLVGFGNGLSEQFFDQQYLAAGPSLDVILGAHELKAGMSFLHTDVDGRELSVSFNQLYATAENFERFGPVYSGFFTLTVAGPRVEGGDLVHLSNDWLGIYVQDDWRVTDTLTLNLGVRWDRDSEFDDNDNVAPRLGFAWSVTPRTVVRGSAGLFYDRFRLGLVRDIPDFGGADYTIGQDLSYPQLFYNTTTIAPIVVGLCINPLAPHAEVAGTPCPFGLPGPQYGFDFLNEIVAPGRAPIPPETVVTRDNVLDLSGLTPEQFLAEVNARVPVLGGALLWYWGPFGALTHALTPPTPYRVTLDPSFATPHTRAYHLGVQRQIGKRQLVAVDLHKREMRNILGTRTTNLAFISRIPGFERTYADGAVNGVRGFGPWFEGEYEAVTVSYTRRMDARFTISAHYTYTDAHDNLPSAQLGNGAPTGPGATASDPTDAYVGFVPEVTDPTTGQNNADGSFIAGNGNFIPRAGTFHNGPDLDRGPSPLAIDHQVVLFGLLQLPLDFQVSAILRWTSGFHFSRGATVPQDPDGNLNFRFRDIDFVKNSYEAPDFENVDLRVAKFFPIGDRVRATVLVEVFNALNEKNAAAVEAFPGRPTPFGQPLQVLPGREVQIGLRFEL